MTTTTTFKRLIKSRQVLSCKFNQRYKLTFSIVLLISFLSSSILAQIDVEPANAVIDPIAIIETIFLGEGVEVTNIDFTGDNQAVGHFTSGQGQIGIDRGIVIGSGFVNNATGAGMDFVSDDTNGPNNDPDLDGISNVPLMDVAKYEITFIPTSDTLRFRYSFASEEYPEFGCSPFNDVFGFFISGPNPAGGNYVSENIALVPELSDPTGTTFTNLPVSIANVHGDDPGTNCVGSYTEYYNDNSMSPFLTYDAYLDVFVAQAIVIPCEEYTIKLAIADGSDAFYDSAVFLEAKSFGTGALDVNIETVSLDGGVAEGCNPGLIIFSLPNPVEEDFIVDATIIDCPNSATNGVDYFGIPTPIVIPAGESRVEFIFEAPEDNIDEGDEFICFDIQKDICNRDTVSIKIVESPLKEVFIPNDTLICQNEIVNLTSSLPQDFVLPPSPNFSYTTNEIITDEIVPNTFPLEISGVVPDYLTQGMIKAVCIDTLQHVFLTDLDLYLITPGGQFLELSTDNGFKVLNGADVDTMINTCFTPFANVPVENGSSLSGPIFMDNPTYTGDFLPEGVWSDLYGEDKPSNGTYELLIIDDETGALARFTGWSICFNPIYNLTYIWSSDVHGEICTNCEDFPMEVDQNTTFYLEVIDSYGCSTIDSFTVTVTDLLPGVTNFVCDSLSPNFIRVTWDGEPTADSYEIFIPGVIDPAINIGNVNEWDITGLDPLTEYEITIRTIGGICGGESSTTICMTVNCEVDPLEIELIEGVSCFGDMDGELDVVITGNFPPFQYEFQGQNDPMGSFVNLTAGEDTLYITDLTGCISKHPITIPTPNTLNVDFEDKIEISCFNESDGTVTADPFGGTMPYDFVWETGENTATATMLEVGWNSVTITDANLCEIVDSILFANPPELTASHLFQDADCFGEASGIAIIDANGGTEPYSYAWGDPLNQMTQQANDLLAGTYIVTITDASLCSITEEVMIGEPAEIETNVIGTNVPCFNDLNGEGLVEVTGGNDPFEFEWDNGEMVNPAVMLNVGKHYVTVMDNEGCTTIDSVTITAPTALEIIFDNEDANCFGAADGEITWMTSGGTGVITVLDEMGNTVNSPLTDLIASEYCFQLVDEAMCVLDTCVTIDQPIEIDLTFEEKLESCFNSNDAEIDITPINGVEPYTFVWEGPMSFEAFGEDIIGVNSGLYAVTITDDNGCTKVQVFNLLEPEEIDVDADVFNIPCKGAFTGIIQITASGGTEPYEFSWLGPNSFVSDEEDLIDVEAGTYTLILTDAQGCIIQKTYEIIEPADGIVSNISAADEVCFGKTNGIASVNPTGGTMPLTILWSNNSNFTNINGLNPGWYYVTITDGSDCSIVDSVEIIERPQMIIEVEQMASLCFESFDGSAEVISIKSDGVDEDLTEFEYLWNSFPLQETPEALNLKGGADYLVIVTDNLGCTAQQEVIIDTPEEVIARLEMIDSISCALGDDGSIVIQGVGGTGPYEYQWGQDANFQEGPAAKNLKAGFYDVTVTDANGCTGSGEFEIKDPFPISLNYRVFDVLCFGENDGEVELIANGGTEPYNFNWSIGSNAEEITGLEQGFYNVTVTDANDCEVVDSVFVDEPAEPLMVSADVKNITCADGQDGAIIIEASGGSGNYIYSLDNFIYNGSVEQIGLSEGSYSIYVKDANGCIDSIPDIAVFSPAPLTLELGPDVYLNYGQTYQFDPMIGNFQLPLTYEWESPDTELLSCIDCQNPFFDAIRQATYKLIVIDGRGCLVEDYINLYIENSDAIFVPTGFTPNNDFNNDLLSVYGLKGVKVKTFRVLDRWGEVMYENTDFEVNDPSIGWDGTFKDKAMLPGMYTWVVEAEFTNGFVEIFSGNTTLIK